MKPIEFKGQNVVFGKSQKEYQPLPAMQLQDGTVVTCWEFTDEEVEEIVKNRKMYISQLTFKSPLQPIFPMVNLSDNIDLVYE